MVGGVSVRWLFRAVFRAARAATGERGMTDLVRVLVTRATRRSDHPCYRLLRCRDAAAVLAVAMWLRLLGAESNSDMNA